MLSGWWFFLPSFSRLFVILYVCVRLRTALQLNPSGSAAPLHRSGNLSICSYARQHIHFFAHQQSTVRICVNTIANIPLTNSSHMSHPISLLE